MDPLALIARLARRPLRAAAAQALAEAAGARHLVVFIMDPDIGTLIPAPGFAAVIPAPERWESFLALAVRDRSARGALPFATETESIDCSAFATDDDAVAVFIGGDPDPAVTSPVIAVLPLLCEAFRCEQMVVNAKATMALARNAAKQLREQAAVLEQARRAAHLELVERRRTEQALQQKAGELERSNRDLQQFAATVSHDLQEPLRMVSSYVTLIERRMSAAIDNRTREYFRFAGEGTVRMSALIRALLDYAQVGATDRVMMTVPLETVLREAIENLAARIADTGADVRIGDMPNVRGDHVLLVQLFQNLVSNAMKFRREGVVPVVAIDASLSDGWWVVRVVDNGIGIAAEHIGRIFRVFQRLHSREVYEGNGIGLATCQRIADLHGGTIIVESTPGEGSQFIVRLPAG